MGSRCLRILAHKPPLFLRVLLTQPHRYPVINVEFFRPRIRLVVSATYV